MRHRRSFRALFIVAIVAAVLWIAATFHLRSLVSIATPIVFGQASTASRPVFPGLQWDHIGDPKSSGYCQDQLDLVTARVKELPTTAMVVVVGGRVLWDYGDQRALSYV